MPADDESSRKKRGAENQLTQHNWENAEDDEGGGEDGGFAKASTEELAKRKIVKARRSGKAPTGAEGAASESTEKSESKPAPFSWTSAASKEPEGDGQAKKNGDASEKGKEDEASQRAGGADNKASSEEKADSSSVKDKDGTEKSKEKESSADGSTKEKESPAKPKDAESDKKPAFSFGSSGFGTSSGFSFGSTSSFGTFSGFSGFGTAGFGSSATGTSTSFGSFGSTSAFSFSNAPSQADAFKAKSKDGEEGDDGDDAGGEDAEKEVPVEKTCQLEEVETCTGEEDEDNVFQVRGKLFVFCTPQELAAKANEGEAASAEAGEAESGDAKPNKDGQSSWVVIGIGNLKINVPKGGDGSRRPRIVMRRQKTFQVCLNTYLLESMVCDKAGPKDVRFTGMRMSADGCPEAELATYLLRVKEEEQANEFVSHVHRYKAK